MNWIKSMGKGMTHHETDQV